jgi:prophage tail gpP-like protein
MNGRGSNHDETVELLIGGMAHGDWESYDVDSDLLIPADAWHVTLGATAEPLPTNVRPGAPFELRVGGELVMTGHVDAIDHVVEKRGHRYSLSGRDRAAVLVDCSAPVFAVKMATLADVTTKIVRELGIHKIDIRAGANKKARLREKVNVDPGATAWQVLSDAAEANGLWPWFEPNGTLVVGGPDYEAPEVATLILRRDGRGNNVMRLERRESIAHRYSQVTVLGQCHGTASEQGKNAVKGFARDDGVNWYRPRIILDPEAETVAIADDRAEKLLADSQIKGFTLLATVVGHRIRCPGHPSDGKLWQPGQRVHVVSEPHAIDGSYFLMARKFAGGRNEGRVTHLVLKEDRVWLPTAHPHKRRHRRGRKNTL